MAGIFIIYIQAPLSHLFKIITGLGNFDFSKHKTNSFEPWITFALISNILIVPIIEELIFRGLIFTRFLKEFNINAAILISSTLFGLIHLPDISQSIFTFVGGVISCLILIRTKSIIYSITFHIVWNGLIFISYYIPIVGLSYN